MDKLPLFQFKQISSRPLDQDLDSTMNDDCQMIALKSMQKEIWEKFIALKSVRREKSHTQPVENLKRCRGRGARGRRKGREPWSVTARHGGAGEKKRAWTESFGSSLFKKLKLSGYRLKEKEPPCFEFFPSIGQADGDETSTASSWHRGERTVFFLSWSDGWIELWSTALFRGPMAMGEKEWRLGVTALKSMQELPFRLHLMSDFSSDYTVGLLKLCSLHWWGVSFKILHKNIYFN